MINLAAGFNRDYAGLPKSCASLPITFHIRTAAFFQYS